jgi:hypothetical protein
MGRVIVLLIGIFFRRGMVQGAVDQLVECVFDVFYVGTLVQEDLKR